MRARSPVSSNVILNLPPTSTGSDQWYSGQTLLYSTAGTPPTGMTNNKLYFACPCDNAGNVDGVDTHNSLWDAPWTVGGATAITPSSQGSGTQTFSYRVWHTKWTAWHTIDQSAHDSWTNGTARAVWIVDPALTDTEATYWASTGMVPPIDRTQVPDTDILDVGKRLSQNTEPLSMMNVSGSSNVGGRQEIGIINEYTSQAWILQNKDSWQKARVTAYAAPSYPFAHVLNEATGYIPALNNGPPTGPGGNGVGGSYADLGAPQPHTYILSDVGGDYEGLATPLQSVPVVAYTSGYGMGLYGRGRVWRNDHYPMYAGVTYLLYGNRHFLEMAYFAGNRVDIVNDYGGSEGQSRDWLPGGSNHYYGLCVPTGGEPRASYWCMRDKQNGAAWGGDSNPERAYFNDQLVEQANFWPLFELWKDGGSAGNFTNGLFYDWNREQQESSFMGTYATWAYYMGYTMLRSPQATYSLNYRIPRYWLAVVGDLPGGLSSWYGSAASYSRTNARKNIQLANPTGIGANIGSLYSTDPADMGTSLEYAVFNHTNIDGSVTASGDTLTTWFGVVQLTNGDLYKDQGNLYGGGPDQLDDSTWYTVSNVNNTTHTFKLINPATGTPFTGYTLGGSPYVCYVYCGMFHFQYGPSTSWWDDNTNYAPYAYSSVIALKILGLGTYTLLGRTIDDAYNTVVTRGPGLRAKETVLGWDVSVVVP